MNLELGQKELDNLISYSLNMAKYLLANQASEFYPFGATIDNKGSIVNIGAFDGDDFPLSNTIINELNKICMQQINEDNISACCITFDCLAKKDDWSDKTDAICIQCFLKDSEYKIIYYYPYKLNSNNNCQN
jgi:hypothetical protein